MHRSILLFAAASLLGAIPALAHDSGSGSGSSVHPGQSIQAAVDAAQPGDTISVFPGTYRETGSPCPTDATRTCAVVVTKADIKLVGLPRGHRRVVLENAGGQEQGIAFAPVGADGTSCLDDPNARLAGPSVRGFTVNGFGGEGISMFCVDAFDIRFDETNDNAEYGIFPSHATNGTVAFNVVTGSNDTGVYVGNSRDVRVMNNLARGNVSGYEIENSTGVRLDHNASIGNTGGILTFTLPFLDLKQNSDNRIDHNWVQANNKANTCVQPTDEVCGVPVGTGILALAVDANRIDHNVVLNNDSYGIAVANFCLGNNLPPDVCAQLDINPDPDDNQVDHNAVFGNGKNPSPLIQPVFGVDLAWDGSGTGNCWSHNAFKTQFPEQLPACH